MLAFECRRDARAACSGLPWRPCRPSPPVRCTQARSTTQTSVYAPATRSASRVFHVFSAVRTFCVAVSSVKGGKGRARRGDISICCVGRRRRVDTHLEADAAPLPVWPRSLRRRGLRDNPLDDFRRGWRIGHEVNTLPSPGDACGEIVVGRCHIELLLIWLIRGECVLPTIPASRKRVAQRTTRIDRRSWRTTHDIEHAGLLGLVAASRQGGGFHRLVPQGLA
jgi:hypothetical protein